ncbi:hypothetical protein L228DRAFT_250618 [Xylona heveae TC161]|uniref:Malate dehydrogenase n=1 Tax=Xylona heveae (strain CBS 132557 / TC161) TaxID=1328760 RepID=A0A164ZVA6_XYLHT|nr:hypothetical protein L228DRAFT_250618 [Xylona heveae TC161]KZF19577.1 hypothetical protein L228DRAFT_250618 [Xylona heveae TC161]
MAIHSLFSRFYLHPRSLLNAVIFALCLAILFSSPSAALPHFSPTRKTRTLGDLSSCALPTTAGSSSLPTPSTSLQLKHVAVGRGVQNYTCASSTSSSVPKAIGAVATLFTADLFAEVDQQGLNDAMSMIVEMPNPSAYSSLGPLNLFALGHHYFSADGTPTFDLGSVGFFHGAKLADIPAPANAPKGQVGEAAVDWLTLGDKGGSTGILEVYRVWTAGGSPPTTCDGQEEVISVQYASQYWLFG